MINFFSKHNLIFYIINFSLIFLYLFPGSLVGYLIYGNIKIQPQITPDFFISSNHFYVFILLSTIGFLTFKKKKLITYLTFYLIILSIILEILHIFIPERSFEWSDLFGNFLGVIIVIFIRNLINKHEFIKK
tara:strand:+ start:923 stop:1318 length:396 start_codon:yes stop_codon:yes gene_type:complete